ncbi:YbaB/EbfC family nucleoid-associated protein [Streptosporangium sp. NBC_01756]|uniref:YbaB/EbfC family nucleoid-associated protein n=1 Tax=Streptosporangium sp. NBC_01756 TaxID=2975950 RepID=UPI002DDC70E1|nr:YbaB/EbfC family nucleoid-associated protein [Streptosporangium sp. NBC_01756]WSC88935.1 YbaB/EbfC family nucleoid-associated protein [Streptosporangium sp. NBC_01756]
MVDSFGDFANIDIDALLRDSQNRVGRFEEAQKRAADVVGRATAADGQITVECTADAGVSRLDIDPRVKRMSVGAMSETILKAIHDADADLKRQLSEIMKDAFGEDAPDLTGGPDAARARVEEAQTAFDRTMNDAIGELDRIRKDLGY